MATILGRTEDSTSGAPTVSIHFDVEQNHAILSLRAKRQTVQIALTRERLEQLTSLNHSILTEMQWHDAEWVYASTPFLRSGYTHLMKKGEHSTFGKTLCGRVEERAWILTPRLQDTQDPEQMCDKCLALYQETLAATL